MLAMTTPSRKLWPVYVLVVLLLGAYQGLNELIPLRSIPQLAAWKPFIWDMTSVVVIATTREKKPAATLPAEDMV